MKKRNVFYPRYHRNLYLKIRVLKKLTITSQLGMSYSRGVTTDPRGVIQTINIFDDGRQTVWDKDILHQDAVNKCKNEKLFFISNRVCNKIDLIHSATDHRC